MIGVAGKFLVPLFLEVIVKFVVEIVVVEIVERIGGAHQSVVDACPKKIAVSSPGNASSEPMLGQSMPAHVDTVVPQLIFLTLVLCSDFRS